MNNELIERIDAQLLEIRESQQYLDSVKSGLPNIFEVLGVSEELLRDCKAALTQQQEAEPVDWGYCPECGCEKYRSTGFAKGRICTACGQEWFKDIDYTNVVRGHLAKPHPPKPAALPQVPEGFSEGAQSFRKMLLEASNPVWWPHVEGVFAVFALKNKFTPVDSQSSAAKEEGK